MSLDAIVEQVVQGLGFELVEFETSPKSRLLRVFIDIERGVTVDDCASVSNQLSRVFEVENIDYDRLEVSSPGLDRPLRRLEDFDRFAGAQVQIKLRLPVGNQRNFVGELQGRRDDTILFSNNGEVLELSFDNIDRARLIPQF